MKLNELNEALVKTGATWTAAENPITALDDVAKKRLLGAKIPAGYVVPKMGIKKAVFTDLPQGIDWRMNNGNFVTPVKMQGQCESCSAFAAIAAMESQLAIEQPLFIELSEADVFFCSSHGATCDGWFVSGGGGLYDASTQRGMIPEELFPYASAFQNNIIGNCPPSCIVPPNRAQNIFSFSNVMHSTDINEIKNYLVNTGPFVAYFEVYEDFYHYQSGIYKHVSGDYLGTHYICVVGYSEDQGGYWMCKNSWDTTWGMEGYFNIGYNECNIGITDKGAVSGIVPPSLVGVSIAPGVSGYMQRSFSHLSAFATGNTGTWLLADFNGTGKQNDLVFIKQGDTCMEVHVASYDSNYQTLTFESGTTFGPESDGTWLMADFNGTGKQDDLVFIKQGSVCMEVHVASRDSNYQTRTLETGTTFAPESDGTWLMADFNGTGNQDDLVFLQRGSDVISVHVASRASNYQTRTWESGTGLSSGFDGTLSVADFDGTGNQDDLVLLSSSGDGDARIGVHVLTRASNYQTQTLASPTTFPLSATGTVLMVNFTGQNKQQADVVFIK